MKLLQGLEINEMYTVQALRIIFKAYIGYKNLWTAWHSGAVTKPPANLENVDDVTVMSSRYGNDIDMFMTEPIMTSEFHFLGIYIHETGQVLMFEAETFIYYRYIGSYICHKDKPWEDLEGDLLREINR